MPISEITKSGTKRDTTADPRKPSVTGREMGIRDLSIFKRAIPGKGTRVLNIFKRASPVGQETVRAMLRGLKRTGNRNKVRETEKARNKLQHEKICRKNPAAVDGIKKLKHEKNIFSDTGIGTLRQCLLQ
jgi:hypothetical protein